MHGSRPRPGHPGLGTEGFGQSAGRVRTRRLHAGRRMFRGWRRAGASPGRRRGSRDEGGHAESRKGLPRAGRDAGSREQRRRIRAPQGLRGMRLALVLLPAADEGPPVPNGLAAHFPAARLAPVEEAARIYAVAALAAVQLHLGKAGRREAGKGKSARSCGRSCRRCRGRSCGGRCAAGLRHDFGLETLPESRHALPPALPRSLSKESRLRARRGWRKELGLESLALPAPCGIRPLRDCRRKACGLGVLSGNISFSCLPGLGRGSGDVRDGSRGADESRGESRSPGADGCPGAGRSLSSDGSPGASGCRGAVRLRGSPARRAFALLPALPALPGPGTQCRNCGGLPGLRARAGLGLGFWLLVLGFWGIALRCGPHDSAYAIHILLIFHIIFQAPASLRGAFRASRALLRAAGPGLMLGPVVYPVGVLGIGRRGGAVRRGGVCRSGLARRAFPTEKRARGRGVEQAELAERGHQFAGPAFPLRREFEVVGVEPAQCALGPVGRRPQPQAQQAEHAFRAEAAAELARFGVLEEVELEADVDVHGFSLRAGPVLLWCGARGAAAFYFRKCKRQKQENL